MQRLDVHRMHRKRPCPARRFTTFVAPGAALAMALLFSSTVTAQEERTVIVVDEEVRAVAEQYHGGHLNVQVDGVQCGRWSMGEANRLPEGGSEFELGLDDQPEECRREGGTIRFLDGNFTGLSNNLTLQRGATLTLGWLQAGAIRIEPEPTPDGRTLLTVDPELRNGVAARTSPYLDVYADRELCGRFNFVEADEVLSGETAAFELARDDQPEACGRDGAVISLVNAHGQHLSAAYRLDVGWQIPIQNFTIPPPHTGGNGEPAPGAPEVGTGFAADSGGGTGTSLAARVGAMVVLLAVLALLVRIRRPGSRTG